MGQYGKYSSQNDKPNFVFRLIMYYILFDKLNIPLNLPSFWSSFTLFLSTYTYTITLVKHGFDTQENYNFKVCKKIITLNLSDIYLSY